MLRNLQGIYTRRHDLDRLLVVFNRLIALDASNAEAVRDRGNLFGDLECHQSAYHDYLRYLELAPRAADVADIQGRVERLRPIATRMN